MTEYDQMLAKLNEATLVDIQTFVNLNPNQKLRWMSVYPERTRDIIDYLINTTKNK